MRRQFALLAGASVLAVASLSNAAPIAPGDLLIYRAGNGESLVNTGNAVFIDEYTRAGVLVQSIPMPTVANGAQQALYSPGNSSSEGLLTRTSDSNYVMLT